MKQSALRLPLALAMITGAISSSSWAAPAPQATTSQEYALEVLDPADPIARRLTIKRYILREEFNETVIAKPVFSATPSAREWRAAWPAIATVQGGEVTLRCGLTAEGRTRDCRPIRETPTAQGFASIAQKLAPHFQVQMPEAPAPTLKGYAVDIPFRFSRAGLAAAEADWEVLPSHESVASALRAANVNPVGAEATLNCTVGPGGVLSRCAVRSENRPGVGRAMLAATQHFRTGLWSLDGQPMVGARINVPVSVN